MKTLCLFAIIFGLMLCGSASAALRTSVATGLWSAAGTWDTGVPVDADTFLVAAGHTVTFDVDQSAFAGLGASTIAATGTLIASTTAGAYVLKMNADLTVNGTLRAGTSEAVPYPSTCTFTVNLSSGSNSIVINNTTGNVQFFCVEPTIKYIKLTAQEAAAQTVLSVDTDVTGDAPWAAGTTVYIADSTNARDVETATLSSTAATTITIGGGGLATQKEIGAVIALITRNIRVINSTDYAFKNGITVASYIGAEVNTTGWAHSTANVTLAGSYLSAGAAFTTYQVSQCNFTGVMCGISTSTYGHGLSTLLTATSDSLVAGFGSSGGYASVVGGVQNGLVQACVMGYSSCIENSVTGDVVGGTAFSSCQSFWFSGTTYNPSNSFIACRNISLGNAQLGQSLGGGPASTNDLNQCGIGKFYNTLFGATTEFSGYTIATFRPQWDYIESSDHDQVVNAYKAWVLGGIVSSQTVSPPTGYTIWYELACESATYPCYRQYQTVVLPGTAIEITGFMRIADAENHTAYPPRLQIIDYFADPLVDSTQSPLDESQIADPDGSDSSWQAVSVIWANQGDSPRTVIVRMIAKHATGDVDTVWSVADYQDQIAAIYGKLPTNYIMGSSVVTDKDDEIDATLVDTSAYDTDAEHAAAIWNALMATYTIELSFGGELQQLDPNITSILANTVAIKAVTDIMQAVNSTVSVADDANSFTIANTGDINDVNDAYEGMTVYVKDATTGDWELRLIENWETGREITVDEDFTFTPEVGDIVIIWGIGYMPPVIFDQFPLPRETTHTIVDRTAASGAATVTLDPMGNDPP